MRRLRCTGAPIVRSTSGVPMRRLRRRQLRLLRRQLHRLHCLQVVARAGPSPWRIRLLHRRLRLHRLQVVAWTMMLFSSTTRGLVALRLHCLHRRRMIHRLAAGGPVVEDVHCQGGVVEARDSTQASRELQELLRLFRPPQELQRRLLRLPRCQRVEQLRALLGLLRRLHRRPHRARVAVWSCTSARRCSLQKSLTSSA